MHPYVHCSIIYNNQDIEGTYMPINMWMDKDVVYTYTMEYDSAIRKKWSTAIHSNVDVNGEYYARWNKSDWERQILPDFTYKCNLKTKQMNKHNAEIEL